jgi:1,4-dihydroxy-2-naphthoate octaprenyltransferase
VARVRAAGDAATGKRTLIVRLGAARGAALYRATTIAAFGALALAGPARLALVLAPVALWRAIAIGDGSNAAAHDRIGFFAVALVIATAAVELIGLVT